MSGKGNNTELKRIIREVDHDIYNLDNLENTLKRTLQHFNNRKRKKRR